MVDKLRDENMVVTVTAGSVSYRIIILKLKRLWTFPRVPGEGSRHPLSDYWSHELCVIDYYNYELLFLSENIRRCFFLVNFFGSIFTEVGNLKPVLLSDTVPLSVQLSLPQ